MYYLWQAGVQLLAIDDSASGSSLYHSMYMLELNSATVCWQDDKRTDKQRKVYSRLHMSLHYLQAADCQHSIACVLLEPRPIFILRGNVVCTYTSFRLMYSLVRGFVEAPCILLWMPVPQPQH